MASMHNIVDANYEVQNADFDNLNPEIVIFFKDNVYFPSPTNMNFTLYQVKIYN